MDACVLSIYLGLNFSKRKMSPWTGVNFSKFGPSRKSNHLVNVFLDKCLVVRDLDRRHYFESFTPWPISYASPLIPYVTTLQRNPLWNQSRLEAVNYPWASFFFSHLRTSITCSFFENSKLSSLSYAYLVIFAFSPHIACYIFLRISLMIPLTHSK